MKTNVKKEETKPGLKKPGPVLLQLPAIAHGLLTVWAQARSKSAEHLDKYSEWAKASRESADRHFLGLCGEWATAQALAKLQPYWVMGIGEEATDTRSGNKGDILLPDGKWIEIKTVSFEGAFLSTRRADGSDFKADYICLAHAPYRLNPDGTIKIIGIIDRGGFFKLAKKKTYPWGECLAIDSKYLISISEFVEKYNGK